MSVPGSTVPSDGNSDGAGVGALSGEASGETDGAGEGVLPMRGSLGREASVTPDSFRTLPAHTARVRTKAQTSSNVMRRKRERICFMGQSFHNKVRDLLASTGRTRPLPRSFCQHGQVRIFSQVCVASSGNAAEQAGEEKLRAQIRQRSRQERKPESGQRQKTKDRK